MSAERIRPPCTYQKSDELPRPVPKLRPYLIPSFRSAHTGVIRKKEDRVPLDRLFAEHSGEYII